MQSGSPPDAAKPLLSNAAWSATQSALTFAISFFLTPFLINRLGVEAYGLYVLLMSLGGLMGLVGLGLGDATLRYVAYYHGRGDSEGINRIVGSTFTIFLVTGCTAWLALYLMAPWIVQFFSLAPSQTELGIHLLRLTGVSFGLSFIIGVFASIPKALQRYDVSVKVALTQSIFSTSGSVVILAAGKGLDALVLWGVITSLFIQSLHLVVARRLLPQISLRPAPSRQGIREVMSYGVFAMLTQVMATIWAQADRLILGVLLGPAAVGYYSAPRTLAFAGVTAISEAGAVLFPRFSTQLTPEQRRRLFLDATWALLCASIVIYVPLTVLMPSLLALWIGADYAGQSAVIGQIIAFSCIARGAFVAYDGLFRGLGKPQYLALLFLLTGTTSLTLNILLISRYGLAGAGYAYLATSLWGFAAIVFAWRRVLSGGGLTPLFRAVALPLGVAYAALVLAQTIHTLVVGDGWVAFFVQAVFFAAGAGMLVVGADWSLGQPHSHAAALFSSARRAFRLST